MRSPSALWQKAIPSLEVAPEMADKRVMRAYLLLLFVLGCARPSHPVPDYSETETEGGSSAAPEYVPAAPENRAVRRPFLWVVRAGPQPSLLFGTIHVGVALDEALGPQRIRDLRASRSVIVEVDPDQIDPGEIIEAARLPSGSLNELFRASIWHDLVNELHTTHDATTLRGVRPWYPMVVLTQQRIAQMHRGRLPHPMDLTIVRHAREAARSVIPLESAADQLATFNAIPQEQVVEIVTEMVSEKENQNAELRRLLQAYRFGDESEMERLIFDPGDLATMPEFYNILFYRRNDAWMPSIRTQLDQGGAFVAVGLGHLLGPEGLVARLRSAGYDVQAVAR